MQIGIGLPNPVPGTPGTRLLEWGRRAEERGFLGVATIDRLAYPSYDSLVQINRKGYPGKWAAQDIKEVSPTVIEVKLRPGMKFHDGKPLTAEDVRFTYDLFRMEKGSESRFWWTSDPTACMVHR